MKRRRNKPEGYADLADLPEDDRIRAIGRYVMENRKTAAVCVDDEPGKAERYAKKLREWFPGISILETIRGVPFKGVATIKVGPANQN